MQKHTLLTTLKILICTLIFFIVPLSTELLTQFVDSRTIALTFVLNTCALLMAFSNHQLVALHWRRFVRQIEENLAYIILSAVLVVIITVVAEKFMSFPMETLDVSLLSDYPFFAPTILIAYTFSYAFCFNTVFKLMTDRIPYKTGPYLMMLISGFLFGAYLCASQFVLPQLMSGMMDVQILAKGFGISFIFSILCSYCYNQTRSIVPMTLGMTLSLLVCIFL